MNKADSILKIQTGITSTKLYNSPYWTDVVNMTNQGKTPHEVYQYIRNEKHYKISYPSVLAACNYIKENEDQALALMKESKKAVLKANEDMKKIAPSLTNMFTRRTNLITEILKRKLVMLQKQNEGKRCKELIIMLDQHKDKISNYNEIINFIGANFTNNNPDPRVENVIRAYIRDLHDIYSYIEQYTGKYEIYEVVNDLSLEITRAAVEIFGRYIKNESPEIRTNILNKFKDSIKNIVEDIKVNKLNIQED